MKKNFKLLVIGSLSSLVIYVSCKKTDSTPPITKIVATDTVATTTVLPLLTASLNEFNATSLNGLQAPSLAPPTNAPSSNFGDMFSPKNVQSLNFVTHGLSVQKNRNNALSVTNNGSSSDCGAKYDTTNTAKFTSGDTASVNVFYHLKYLVSCTNNAVSMINITDTLGSTFVSPKLNGFINLGINLDLTPSDATNNPNIAENGSINYILNLSYYGQSANVSVNYKIINVVATTRGGNIISGTINFRTKSNDGKGTGWDYSGTLVYDGNNQATLTINSIVYKVNLLLNTVTKA